MKIRIAINENEFLIGILILIINVRKKAIVIAKKRKIKHKMGVINFL